MWLDAIRWSWRGLGVAVRVCQLAIIFAPTIFLVPVVYLIDQVTPGKQGDIVVALWWRIVRAGIELSGPAFIKLAQWAAMRSDIFATSLCRELSRLHDDGSTHSWATTCATLDSALGTDWHNIIEINDRTPVGSGCVAQVYRGRLRAGADKDSIVAVKVIHPAIRAGVERDIDILRTLTWMVDCFPFFRSLGLSDAVEEFSALISTQMDLRNEADNLKRFRSDFSGDDRVQFPRPVDSMVSSTVLVESFEPGISSSELIASQSDATRQAGQIICDLYLQMLFKYNFTHGDMHPGNILIRGIDEFGTQTGPIGVTLLDAGIVTELTHSDHANFIDLFSSIAHKVSDFIIVLLFFKEVCVRFRCCGMLFRCFYYINYIFL